MQSVRFALAAMMIATFAAGSARAQGIKPNAEDVRTIETCMKAKSSVTAGDLCIEIIAQPCTERPGGGSTQGGADCYRRETAVWDDMLNESFRRLRQTLNDAQALKMRDMQRAWITSRDRSCGFYHDVIEGTLATTASAACLNRETALRALFLLTFLDRTSR